jgi:dihydroxy-acid dehydratase
LGADLRLADFDRLSGQTPLLTKLKPASAVTVTDFHGAGGVGAVMAELWQAGLIDGEAPAVEGGTIGERLAGRAGADGTVIRAISAPLASEGGWRCCAGTWRRWGRW